MDARGPRILSPARSGPAALNRTGQAFGLRGPEVLGLAEADQFIEALSTFGLAFLFFLAGFEIDFQAHRLGEAAAARVPEAKRSVPTSPALAW